MCPITINKALLLQEGILKFELSWTAVVNNIVNCSINNADELNMTIRMASFPYNLPFPNEMNNIISALNDVIKQRVLFYQIFTQEEFQSFDMMIRQFYLICPLNNSKQSYKCNNYATFLGAMKEIQACMEKLGYYSNINKQRIVMNKGTNVAYFE